MVMVCTHCGGACAQALRFCPHCAAALGGAPSRPAAPLPAPVQPALGEARPQACWRPAGAGAAQALVPGAVGKPLALVAALLPESPPPATPTPSARPAAGRPHNAAAAALAWGGGGLLLCAALLLGAQQFMRLLPGTLMDAWPSVGEPTSQGAAHTSEQEAAQPPAEAAPPAPMNTNALAEAINAELVRIGADEVRVAVAEDGTTTVSGRLDNQSDRGEVLRWLQSVPAVSRVVDRIQVAPAPPPRAAPMPAPPLRAAPPVVSTAPAPARADPTSSPLPSPPPTPAATPPDAAAITRALQRELARLGLSEITVEIDPATLQITLRGTVNGTARKAQAFAAARAVHPGSRVRDLVFLVEE